MEEVGALPETIGPIENIDVTNENDMNIFTRVFQLIIQRTKSNHLKDDISIDKLEMRLERKLAYILRLLSIRAFKKGKRKSLPSNRHVSMNFKGPLIDKIIYQWENEFCRRVAGELLNSEVFKLRFYIDITLSNEREYAFREGELSIVMHYYVHK